MKWKVFDNKIIMTTASMYVMKGKEVKVHSFLNVSEELKKQAGLFSSMRSHPRFTMAAMLDVSFDEPETKIPKLFDVYQTLKKEKFKSGTSTYIAASTLLNEESPAEDIAKRAMALYQEMKKEHPFLTGTGDYPLAVLLALEEQNDMIQRIESCYDALSRQGLKKGNDLQFLSHILSMGSQENPQPLVHRTVEVHDAFKNAGIRPKMMYYPMIGMLALLPAEQVDIPEIHDMYEQLKGIKHFKWNKDMNVLIAGSFFVSEKLEHAGLAETSLYTSLESILQAQQAAMIASITAAGAAASANSGSN
ncbi:DUF4003 family protein [Salibacterium aidingense]|uniref:DUF4003 family protein n=1 Tax=Salibacterium aidingense TaxID=384933 RepID=UPI003BD8F82B